MSHEPAKEAETPKLRPVKAMRFVGLLVLVAAAVAATGVKSRRSDETKLARWTVEQAVPNVAVDAPKRDEESRNVSLPGDVEAFYSASIHGQASGYVHDWKVDIGARVKRDQVLAVVDTPELDQRVTAAEGELVKAKSQQALAHVTAERWNTLRSSSAVSQQAIDEKQSAAAAADAEVDAAKANLDRLRAQKAFANITAPFDGVVTARNVDIGSLVRADGASGAPPLFVVSDVSRVRVYVRAPQVYASQLHVGMDAKLQLPEYPGRSFDAHIATTSDAIDAKSRALLVELHADNSDGLLQPGAFAQVDFELPPPADAMSVPASALLFRDQAIFVATVDSNSRIAMKKIGITRDYGTRVEVEGGLSMQDRIVRNPSDSFVNGDVVRVVDDSAADKAGGSKPSGREAVSSAK
jgi:RND family efflux transporter MFP subunit